MNKKGLLQVFQVRFHLITPLQITRVIWLSLFPGYPFSPNISEFIFFYLWEPTDYKVTEFPTKIELVLWLYMQYSLEIKVEMNSFKPSS